MGFFVYTTQHLLFVYNWEIFPPYLNILLLFFSCVCVKFFTHLNDFEYKRCILKIIFQWEMYLSNIFTWIGVINVHINHGDTSILYKHWKIDYLITNRIVCGVKLTVELSLSFPTPAPRDSPSELEPAGDFIWALADL